MTEVYASTEQTGGYCNSESRAGAHFTFNFFSFIEDTQKGFDGRDLAVNIAHWLQFVPSCANNWVVSTGQYNDRHDFFKFQLGNHDQTRVATRLGPENVDALNVVASMLPGARITYQGEEIGQENGNLSQFL